MGDTLVGICYRPPDQEEVDEAFFRQLGEASCLQVLVFMGSSATCSKGNIREHSQSRRSLEHIDDNFLTKVTEEPRKGGTLLELIQTRKNCWGHEGQGQPLLK